MLTKLQISYRKRREHLSRDDLQKNKAIIESLKGGHHAPNLDQNGEVNHYEFVATMYQ